MAIRRQNCWSTAPLDLKWQYDSGGGRGPCALLAAGSLGVLDLFTGPEADLSVHQRRQLLERAHRVVHPSRALSEDVGSTEPSRPPSCGAKSGATRNSGSHLISHGS